MRDFGTRASRFFDGLKSQLRADGAHSALAAAVRPCVEQLERRQLLTTYAVDTFADLLNSGDGYTSLREAIAMAAANPGDDTIQLQSGTYVLAGSELQIRDSSGKLVIEGIGGITTIDGQQQSRVFSVSDSNVELSGLNVTGGMAGDYGGGIYSFNSMLALADSTITGNTAGHYGGGIFNFVGSILTLNNSAVSENTATQYDGGGIYSQSGSALTLTDSTVSGNRARRGGGVANADGSTFTLTSSTVSGNAASQSGGGISNHDNSTATLANSTVSGNSASTGGGIYNYYSTLIAVSSTVSSNSAINSGGGIFGYSSTTRLTNMTVSGNDSSYGGGIGNGDLSALSLINSTIAHNAARNGSGGVHNNTGATVAAANTIIATNTAPLNRDAGGVISSSGHNVIGVKDGSSGWLISDRTGTAASPLDPKLAPLTNNGGRTETMKPLAGSPALDAGNNTLAVDEGGAALANDQRGPNFNRIRGAAVDIGAIENQPPISTILTPPGPLYEGSSIHMAAQVIDPEISDTHSYAWTVTKDGSPYLSGNQNYLSFTPSDDGQYVVSLSVTDDAGGTGADTKTLDVDNVAPTLALNGDSSITEGTSYRLTLAPVVDQGADTVAAYLIDWGDGAGTHYIPAGNLAPDRTVDHTYAIGTAADAPRTITVTVVDEDGTHARAGAKSIAVHLAVSIIGPTSGLEASGISFNSAVSGTNDSTRLYTWALHRDGNPANQLGSSYNFGTSFGFTPPDNGTYVLSLSVTDSSRRTGSASKTITIHNVAPTPLVLGPATGTEGTAIHLPAHVTEQTTSDSIVRYDWVVTRNGNPYYATSGVNYISLMPVDEGNYDVTLIVEDDDGGVGTTTRRIAVSNVLPTLSLSGADSLAEGSTYALVLGQVVDPGQDTVGNYLINWGDGTGDHLVPAANLPPDRTVRHTYRDGSMAATITVKVVDEDGTHLSGTKTVQVSNVTPQLELNGASSVAEGTSYQLTLGPIQDPGADTAAAYLIDWGDGTGSHHIPAANLSPDRVVSHVYGDGPFVATITVRIADEDGTFVAATKSVQVTNVTPTISLAGESRIPEGSQYRLTLGDVVDSGSETPAAYLIDWGDGSGSHHVPAANMPADRTLTHEFEEGPHTHTITVRIVDEDGTHVAGTKNIDVDNAPPTASATGPAQLVPYESATFAFSATDPSFADSAAPITYEIDWDGDGLADEIVIGSTEGVNVTHAFASTGSFTVAVVATDRDGGASAPASAGTTSVTTTRLDSDGRLLVGGDGRFEVLQGSVLVRLNGTEVAHLPEEQVTALSIFGGQGDDHISVAPEILIPTTLSGGAGNDVVQAGGGNAVLIGGAGNDTLQGGAGLNTIVITEDGGTNSYIPGGGSVVLDGGESATSPHFAPSLGTVVASSGSAPLELGAAFHVSATYQDLDLALPVNEALTAVWNWGDGTTSAGTISADAITASHTYAAAGVYIVQVTLTDNTGAVATASYKYAVVYDPAAGFVTGGGWIDSPAGAYAEDPLLSGRATFGFVSQYKKGATTPSGQTQFQFNAGNLNFNSTSYDWLVVGGDKAKYKGIGTINGQGSYGFMLTAVDGKDGGPDRFRIKIWDLVTDEVVYDNQMGKGDDGDDATAIGGGSIIVHTK